MTRPSLKSERPKRPRREFFIFMENFRIRYQTENPGNKELGTVGDAGCTEWMVNFDTGDAFQRRLQAASAEDDYNIKMLTYVRERKEKAEETKKRKAQT